MRPTYWSRAKRALTAADPILAALIAQHPRVALVSRGDAFLTLARSIVGQQISVKAADAVWQRVQASCPCMTPVALLRKRAQTLRACGLSARKVEYLRDLASHFQTGRVQPERFDLLDDEAIIAQLTDIRGIGRWSAQMFLIFNLLRPNVLPLDDLGLLKAIGRHYLGGVKAEELVGAQGRQRLAPIVQAWDPWCSVATWYLWRSLDPVPVAY